MKLSKWGFRKSIFGVENLDKIYDLLEGKLTVYRLRGRQCMVWKDGAITDEIKQLSIKLGKPWYSYKNYKFNISPSIGMSESNYLKEKAKEEAEKAEYDRIQEEKRLAREKKQQKKANADRGIYGIYCNDKLVYIGKTDVDFETRFKQHKYALESGSNSQYLYKYLSMMKRDEGCVITLKPLVNVKDLKVKGTIRNRDIEAMELALIQLYQPICNIQGIKQDYEFTY